MNPTSYAAGEYIADLCNVSVFTVLEQREAAVAVHNALLRIAPEHRAPYAEAVAFVAALHREPDRDIVAAGLELASGALLDLVGTHIHCHRYGDWSDTAFRSHCLRERAKCLERMAQARAMYESADPTMRIARQAAKQAAPINCRCVVDLPEPARTGAPKGGGLEWL